MTLIIKKTFSITVETVALLVYGPIFQWQKDLDNGSYSSEGLGIASQNFLVPTDTNNYAALAQFSTNHSCSFILSLHVVWEKLVLSVLHFEVNTRGVKIHQFLRWQFNCINQTR